MPVELETFQPTAPPFTFPLLKKAVQLSGCLSVSITDFPGRIGLALPGSGGLLALICCGQWAGDVASGSLTPGHENGGRKWRETFIQGPSPTNQEHL